MTMTITKEKKDFHINHCLVNLIIDEPFFSALSCEIDKIKTNSIPTAGVLWNKKTMNFELLYNPEFMSSLNSHQIKGVLKHEFYHIILEHLNSRCPYLIPSKEEYSKFSNSKKQEMQEQKQLWNYATDLCINSHLKEEELPKDCCIPGKGIFKDLPLSKSAEWYYQELKKNNKKYFQEQKIIEIQFDSHEGWDGDDKEQQKDGDSLSEENVIKKEKIKSLIKKAIKESIERSNNWGTLSRPIKEYIIEFVNQNEFIPWEKELQYFIKKSQRGIKLNTQKRINNKYPYIHPGRKTRRNLPNIVIGIDESGSMYDELLGKLTNTLNDLSKIASFTVIPFDTEVYKEEIFQWGKNQHKQIKRVVQGGTDFNCITKYVNDNKNGNWDGLIILTDMCAEKPIESRIQRMWITTEEYAKKPYFQTNDKVSIVRTNNK